jgi:hypothetical protein
LDFDSGGDYIAGISEAELFQRLREQAASPLKTRVVTVEFSANATNLEMAKISGQIIITAMQVLEAHGLHPSSIRNEDKEAETPKTEKENPEYMI